MSNIDCSACSTLREDAPEFVQNGVSKSVATSLKNNTGFSKKNDDCEDLLNANDCLVGRMDSELEAYDTCDWKKFMHKFIPNLYETIKAIIYSICGLWQNVEKIWCWLEHMTTTPKTYSIHAYEDDDPSKPALNNFRIVDGVEMRPPGPNEVGIQVRCLGSRAFVNGSLRFSGNMPSDYTNGAAVPWSYLEHGCAALTNVMGWTWGRNGTGCQVLIWEIQFKKCQLGFSRMFGRGYLNVGTAGDFLMRVFLFKKGDEIPPDYSMDRIDDPDDPHYGEYGQGWYYFNPDDDDMMLLQVRLTYTRVPLGGVTPGGVFDVVACPDTWEC